MSQRRANFTEPQKADILREHFKGCSVPDLCAKYDLHASQLFLWKKRVLANLEGALEGEAVRTQERLEIKWLTKENEVLRHALETTFANPRVEEFILKKK